MTVCLFPATKGESLSPGMEPKTTGRTSYTPQRGLSNGTRHQHRQGACAPSEPGSCPAGPPLPPCSLGFSSWYLAPVRERQGPRAPGQRWTVRGPYKARLRAWPRAGQWGGCVPRGPRSPCVFSLTLETRLHGPRERRWGKHTVFLAKT